MSGLSKGSPDRSRPIISNKNIQYKKVSKNKYSKTKTINDSSLNKEGTSSEENNFVRSSTLDHKLPKLNIKEIGSSKRMKTAKELDDLEFTNKTRLQFQSNKVEI